MSRRYQFSLRAFLVCLVVLAIVIAKHRDGMRDWLEALWAGKPVNQITIVGPPSRQVFTPPSPNEIASALEKAGKVNRLPKNFRLILDPVADYDDPPNSSGSHLHHSHYKCQIVGDENEATRTIFIDYNHLFVPSAK